MIYRNQCMPPLFFQHGSTTVSYPSTPTQLSFSPSLPRKDLLFFLTHNPYLSFTFLHLSKTHVPFWPALSPPWNAVFLKLFLHICLLSEIKTYFLT